MSNYRLFKLELDSDRLESVREHFDHLSDEREVFERGLDLENMNAEAAWLDDDEPALYYLHEEGDDYPADVELGDIDDPELVKLSQTHDRLFQEVAAEGVNHFDDLVEFEPLFAASARDS